MATSDHQFAIDVQNLRVQRGQTKILRGLNCQIPTGQCTAILGPNGCGKTTFTRVLTGHAFFSHGNVNVLGQSIGHTDIRHLRQRISVVNPTSSTAASHVSGAVVDADLTAHEAVLTGFFGSVGLYDRPTVEQHDKAEATLKRVGLSQRIDLRFALLSTGEQRRCLIARALVNEPELLILDEPTAGLDIAGREQVLATVEHVLDSQPKIDVKNDSRDDSQNNGQNNASTSRRATTVLMITHHVEELSPRTSKVLLMRDGQFVKTGTPEQTITPESLTETFGCKVFVQKRNGRYWLEILPEAWLDLMRDGED